MQPIAIGLAQVRVQLAGGDDQIARAVEQLQGVAQGTRVEQPRFSLCSNGGAGASWCMVAILGTERP